MNANFPILGALADRGKYSYVPSPRAPFRTLRNRVAQLVVSGCMLVTAFVPSAYAWSNHALGTWQVASIMPQVANAKPVYPESLNDWIEAEGLNLQEILEKEEQWARESVRQYPARPDILRYRYTGVAIADRAAFLSAIRINPSARLNQYLQLRPGQDVGPSKLLLPSEITTLQHSVTVKNAQFIAIDSHLPLLAGDVLASASDEPDYGLDIGLFDNNNTDYGRRYGFGKEPFGNPALEYSTQAPFHMGFFHESALIYRAAPFLEHTYPEYRIHLYRSLSQYAFRTGHAYWGWRFAGWALHYVQDLTQPYHTRVLPNASTVGMMWTNILDICGFPKRKHDQIVLVSNRHQALENYQYYRMRAAYLTGKTDDGLLLAVRSGGIQGNAKLDSTWVRNTLTLESWAESDQVDAMLTRVLPSLYVSDPEYLFGETDPNINIYESLSKAPSVDATVTQLVAGLMQHFGARSRQFLDDLLLKIET